MDKSNIVKTCRTCNNWRK